MDSGFLPFGIRRATGTRTPPPTYHRPAGSVRGAQFAIGHSPTPRDEVPSAARKLGLRYEEKILGLLAFRFPKELRRSPWIEFWNAKGKRFCQPDALIFLPSHIVIVEVKRIHTSNSYYQLAEIYRPVLSSMFPGTDIQLVEVCSSFDPALSYPGPMEMLEDIEDRTRSPLAIGVLPWKA